MKRITRNTSNQSEVFAIQFNMKEQLNQMMLVMQKANRRSEESTKALKETETTFKIQIEELSKENAQLKDMTIFVRPASMAVHVISCDLTS